MFSSSLAETGVLKARRDSKYYERQAFFDSLTANNSRRTLSGNITAIESNALTGAIRSLQLRLLEFRVRSMRSTGHLIGVCATEEREVLFSTSPEEFTTCSKVC
ncbi:hypothetical protein PM082_008477 [Marasmius tenuissimus]|nr:hypothetical protein PM082_008477 [Marasmius tenuissimus]